MCAYNYAAIQRNKTQYVKIWNDGTVSYLQINLSEYEYIQLLRKKNHKKEGTVTSIQNIY